VHHARVLAVSHRDGSKSMIRGRPRFPFRPFSASSRRFRHETHRRLRMIQSLTLPQPAQTTRNASRQARTAPTGCPACAAPSEQVRHAARASYGSGLLSRAESHSRAQPMRGSVIARRSQGNTSMVCMVGEAQTTRRGLASGCTGPRRRGHFRPGVRRLSGIWHLHGLSFRGSRRGHGKTRMNRLLRNRN
jgi:hypothetical protein